MNDYNIIPSKLLTQEIKVNFLPNFKFNNHFVLNFTSKSSDEEKENLSFFNEIDSFNFIPSLSDDYNKPTLDEFLPFNSKKITNSSISFSSFKKPNLFTNTEKNCFLLEDKENKLQKKRFREKRPRRENQDNIRRKIKRGFFNNALIRKLNDKLRSIGVIKYFEKFPHHFVNDVNRKKNKQILGMTLQEVFENEELYLLKDKLALNNYLHNMKILQDEEIKENEEFKIILNENISELYEEYINSDEFKISEINRLKKYKMQDIYIAKYINLAKNLIEFFNQ
jgi:hypothetical protein